MNKLYLFYIIDITIDFDKFQGIILDEVIRKDNNEVALYAYTTSKKISKRFKKERNMDLFTYIEKNVSDEELENFKDEHQEIELDIHILTTSFEKDKRTSFNTIECVLSEYEYQNLSLYAETFFNDYMKDIFKYNLINNIEIFNERLRYILVEDYFLDIVYYSVTHPFEILPDSYYIFDEVGFFIRLYGNTLKMK